MAEIINLLPENVANQIAAGEVVQRPASVVKELLENAIDAEASQITLIFKDGGNSFIQVVDNGKGMSATDARMCWERHATSKIKSADDLFHLHSFGFRGEALASIGSVAQIEMVSKMKKEETGTLIKLDGGKFLKQEFTACSNGTKITVRNLFYNVPARRNFLKSVSVETRHIFDEFIRIALAYPEVAFKLFNHDKEVYDLPATSLKSRIVALLGKIKSEDLLPLNETTEIVSVSGFAAKPEIAKKTRGEQFLFVNKRFIKDPYLQHAIKSAYDKLIPSDFHPLYVVFLDIDPTKIDVNVHPTKTEIKFEEGQAIYSLVKASVRKSLGAFVLVPEADGFLEQSFRNGESRMDSGTLRMPEPRVNKSFNPFESDNKMKPGTRTYGWEKLYEPFHADGKFEQPIQEKVNNQQNLFEKPLIQAAEVVFQWEDLLISKVGGELFVVNILLARERIWYERYLNSLKNRKSTTQQLLFPRTVVFSHTDYELLSGLLDYVRSLGFDIGEFGKETFVINGLPADLPKGSEQKLLEGLLDSFKENKEKHKLDELENMARSMAKNAAIMSGTTLTEKEQHYLLSELLKCDFPKYCPFGRPVFVNLQREDISKSFKI
jgi:DNA mismatch repair protein MutL